MGIGLVQIAPHSGRTDDYPMVVPESQVITPSGITTTLPSDADNDGRRGGRHRPRHKRSSVGKVQLMLFS